MKQTRYFRYCVPKLHFVVENLDYHNPFRSSCLYLKVRFLRVYKNDYELKNYFKEGKITDIQSPYDDFMREEYVRPVSNKVGRLFKKRLMACK